MERNVDPQCRGSGLPPGDLIYQRIDYWWLELLEDSLRGLSEFLYLYRKVRNSRKPKLQATLRRFSCPEYPAAPKISRRFCGLHSLGIIKMRSPAINGYLEPLVIGVAAATLLCGCSTPQKMGEAELESLGVRVGVLHWEASSRLGEKGYACSVVVEVKTHIGRLGHRYLKTSIHRVAIHGQCHQFGILGLKRLGHG